MRQCGEGREAMITCAACGAYHASMSMLEVPGRGLLCQRCAKRAVKHLPKKGVQKMTLENNIRQLEIEKEATEQELVELEQNGADGRAVAGKRRRLEAINERLNAAQATMEDLQAERLCACGCGVVTKKTWAPGHDARLKGALARLENEETTWEAIQEQFSAAVLQNLMICSCCGKQAVVHESGMGPVCRAGRCKCQGVAATPA